MALDQRSYTDGHFELQIDGSQSSAYLKSVEGGFTKASVLSEPIGTHNGRIKHMSTAGIDPFSFQVGLSGAQDILAWIQASWNKNWSRRNGQITHADFNLDQTFEYQFMDALILETTFPALDGASKEAGYLKVKIQPETAKSQNSAGPKLQANAAPSQKLWLASRFKLTIDQGCPGIEMVSKIDSFTVKQTIQKHYNGEDRFPQIEPSAIEFPNISGTMSLKYADALLKWHEDYVIKGTADPKVQKSGAIEFLSPSSNDAIFHVDLFGIAPVVAEVLPSTANNKDIKRVKFEFYVHHMDVGTGAHTPG